MATFFDRLTLSAYMDGELDWKTMQKVEAFIDRDREARQFILDNMRTTVLLRAGSTDALLEPVPDRLRTIAAGAGSTPWIRPEAWFQVFKLAAAFALVVIGIGMGFILKPGAKLSPRHPFHLLPAAYQQAINQSLESHLSGNALALDFKADRLRIVVTPIRTYRNKDGQYYRGYTMELISGGEKQTLRGLAYRSGRSDWRTTALFAPKS